MAEHAVVQTARRRVLLVDDEPDVVKVVGKRLEAAGFHVDIAMDGQAALAKVRESPPDLMILDLMLPKVDGYEVCTLVKQNAQTRHIPVIMFTAKREEQDYWKGMACGADAYLTKPFQSEVLERLVNRLIQTILARRGSAEEASNGGH